MRLRFRSILLLVASCGACFATGVAGEELAVRSVTPRTEHIQRYGLFELRADISGSYQNPFDPDQIDVSAEFTAPSGKKSVVPGFWYQDYAEYQPTEKPRQAVDLLKLFIAEQDWPRGAQPEFFIDDVALLDDAGHEVPFDDMEQGEATRWGPADRASWSTEVVHGGKRALHFAPTIAAVENWPGVQRILNNVDWTRYRGVVLWIYPHNVVPSCPIQLYYHDKTYGNSAIMQWVCGQRDLQPDRWNRLVWKWTDPPPAIRLKPQGTPQWRVRFTPTETGMYRYVVRGRQGEQVVTSAPQEVAVRDSNLPGFVRVSPDDPHYFVFDNGKPFFPIGHDVPWRLADVRAYFPKMKAHGENCTYFILCPWDMSFEWSKLGVYDLDRAAQFDRVVEAAQQNGIYLKLSFDIHDALRRNAQWKNNPYNAARGGPCATVDDFYTNANAWKFYRNRLRYIAARWGYSTNIMGWDPVAELDGGTELKGAPGWGYPRRPGGDELSAMLAAWLTKVARYLNTVDPYGRLFTSSYGGSTSDDNHWRLPEIRYLQIHDYNEPDYAAAISEWCRTLTQRYRKPMMVTEFGWNTRATSDSIDPDGICLHNGIWASVMSGSAAGALNWWWERIDRLDLYRLFPPLRRFVTPIDWPHENFRPASVELKTPDQGRFRTVAVRATAGFGEDGGETFTVAPDGSLANGSKPPTHLMAPGRTEKRICPRFEVNYPAAGTFAVDVGSVSPAARLDIFLDGRLARSQELPVENVPGKHSTYQPEYKLWRCDYNESFAIDVPAGKHEIRVENGKPGISWIQVTGYQLGNYAPPVLRVFGLTGRTTTILWFQNAESVWTNQNAATPAPITGATATVTGLAHGRYAVEWWDTFSGTVVKHEQVPAAQGELRLNLPPIARDVAVKLRAQL